MTDRESIRQFDAIAEARWASSDDLMARAKDQADDPKEIWIYVRLDDQDREDVREISFRLPADIPALDLLERGYAIDGNKAVGSVYFEPKESQFLYPDPSSGPDDPFSVESTLSEALRYAELSLVKFLKERGYTAAFK